MTTSEEKMRDTKEEKAVASIPAKIMGVATVGAIGMSVLALGGLAVAAVVTMGAVSAPLLLFLSPILVPVGTVVVITTAGMLGIGAACLAALVVFSWLYGYKKGRPVVGAEQVESIQRSLAESVEAVKEKAGEALGTAKEKAVETKEKAQEKASSQQKTPPQQEASGSRGKAPTT